ncbi:alkaline phosphatase family protein [Risungbinella massiliensis]|uniref:alkaline phosphatase family protein n=1 Tax=Risungbinella massiliensis TaxID=1329796 RepID=UPI0005CC127A|nr:alkaline phosphatase family protein [Risungbinella massiliensis]
MALFLWILGTILLLAILLDLAYHASQKSRSQLNMLRTSEQTKNPGKPVILLIVDSLMDAPLRETIAMRKAPALQFLMEHGNYIPKMVSAFPTMSVTIDSTLLTGKLPREHHIYGLMYYHSDEKRIVNFGTGAIESLLVGVKKIVQDSLLRLNQQYLNPKTPTIHEELKETASINALVYRGPEAHTIVPPWPVAWFGILPRKIAVSASKFFSFGVLHRISPKSKKGKAWNKFGMNDRFTQMELVSLIQHDLLPPFTIAYLPKNDDPVHRKGPAEVKGILKVDKEISTILNSFPSWEEAISSCIWVVMGDSGQANILEDRSQAHVDLKPYFSSYSITSPKQKRSHPDDQLAICVNERMAFLYLLDEKITIEEIVKHCLQESRIDLIAWAENGWIHVMSGQTEGHFQYRPEGPYQDEFDQTWDMVGDLFLADLTIEEQKIQYGFYPDILMRLYGVMDTAERVIVITVAPGYEMVYETSPRHRGGSHGGLHQMDSQIPMIICGTDKKPRYPRIIDIKEWIIELVQEQTTEQEQIKEQAPENG